MNNYKTCTILFCLLSMISCSNKERTPQSITKSLIGIEINNDVRVGEFKDQWGSMTGDGMSFIVFNLNAYQLKCLKDSCKEKGYKILPLKETLPDGYIYHFLNQSDTIGYYRLEVDKKDNRNYCIVILSEVSKRLIVYNVIN